MTEEHRGESQNAAPGHYRGTSENWKPILALGAAVLVLGLIFSQPASSHDEEFRNGSDTFDDLAIMGGVKRTNLSKDFRGGEATAVMGGIDIDLRDAEMERSEATLDVSSVMGGVKIRVPENWTVVSRVSSVLGGFKDDTRHPSKSEHRLVLRGTVVMGGIKVTN